MTIKMPSLGKFGLQHCDLPTMVQNVDVMLRLLTLDIDPRSTKPIAKYSYALTIGLGACYFYVYLVSMVWFVLVRCRETDDLLSALIVFSLGIASEIAVSKLLYVLVHRSEVRHIVAGYLACDELPALSTRFASNLAVNLKRVKRRALTFWFVIYGNCILYILKPIIQPGRHVMEDFFILYGLEPMFETPNYQFALFALAASSIFIGHSTSNITAFHMIITGYTESQMISLSHELFYMWSDAEKELKEKPTLLPDNRNEIESLNEIIKRRLNEIIKRHIVVINLHKEVEDLFRGAIAVEFMLLILALIAELLGGLRNTYMEVPFAMLVVATDCWTGQGIVDSCNFFERSAYDSKWESFDKANMKTVNLVLRMSQKTFKLSAGGVAMLDLACFMSINKCIYSTYTTLESMMS